MYGIFNVNENLHKKGLLVQVNELIPNEEGEYHVVIGSQTISVYSGTVLHTFSMVFCPIKFY